MAGTRPHGSWPSPLDARRVAAASLRLARPRVRGDEVFWLEGRPEEAGRQALLRSRGAGSAEEVGPAGWDVRSLVHEYGGGDYLASHDAVFFVARGEPGLWRVGASGLAAVAGAVPHARYADFARSPDGGWLVAVEEEAREGTEPANRLVAFDLVAGERRVLDASHDFVASACFAPDGRALAWLTWDHPNLPWDGTTLWRRAWGRGGPAGEPHAVAGGARESIFQPGFSPAGVLTFVSDRGGWWNLHQCRGDRVVGLAPREAEFGVPQWQLGVRTWGFLSEQLLLCVERGAGRDRLVTLDVASGETDEWRLSYDSIGDLHVGSRLATFLGAGPRTPPAVCVLDLASRRVEERRRAFVLDLAPGFVAEAEAIEFPAGGGGGDGETVHGFLYRPAHPDCHAPKRDRPPLLVKSHGGPTGAASSALALGLQYWTSRGFAVVDVDYRGSTGYGRAYRERLCGSWGLLDVEDCCSAALYLAGKGLADAARLTISGGSAGGFTTLCALTFRDVFAAGASRYGIGDLEALARDTHKFEARYLDSLVGPWPERRNVYRARSPIHHVDRLARPVIFFQGLEDRVVPPAQAEAMVAALAARGLPHAYVTFPDERHGFRAAANIATTLEGELYFYGEVLGFDTDFSSGADPGSGVGMAPAGVVIRR